MFLVRFSLGDHIEYTPFLQGAPALHVADQIDVVTLAGYVHEACDS